MLLAVGQSLSVRAAQVLTEEQHRQLVVIFRRLSPLRVAPFVVIALLFALATSLHLMADDPLLVVLSAVLLVVLGVHHVVLYQHLSQGALPQHAVRTLTTGRLVSSAGLLVLMLPLLFGFA